MGTLFLVATPIGNLRDISQRALEVLNQADLIACEDTRQTIKLLNHFGIQKPLTSYHEFNEQKKAEELGKEAQHYLHTHHLLARSVTMFQIAIAVGAISALTKRKTFWFVSLVFGAVGLVLMLQSFMSMRGL